MNFRGSLYQVNSSLALRIEEPTEAQLLGEAHGKVQSAPSGAAPRCKPKHSKAGSWEIPFKTTLRAKQATPYVDTPDLLWHFYSSYLITHLRS